MSGLMLLSISLTALVGALCTLLYMQVAKSLVQQQAQQLNLDRIESLIGALTEKQQSTHHRIDQLATDVLQREIYQTADDRHQLAIQSAKEGRSTFELMQLHGLSSDEAALIESLHAPVVEAAVPVTKRNTRTIRNANLIDPDAVDAV